MATKLEDSPTLDEIEAAAAKLTPGPRGVLIDRLQKMDEVRDPEIEAAWDTEIRRRIEEIDSGKVQCLDGDEVMAEMKAKYCK